MSGSNEMSAMQPMPGAPSLGDLQHQIERVPWHYLSHAYGVATDAPQKLRGFIGVSGVTEPDDTDWLENSILHQGNIYSASLPVMSILIDLLAAQPNHPCASEILEHLGWMAQSYVDVQANPTGEDKEHPVRVSANGDPIWEVWVDQPAPSPKWDRDRFILSQYVRSKGVRRVIERGLPLVEWCFSHPRLNVCTAALSAWFWMIEVATPPNAVDELWKIADTTECEPGTRLAAVMVLDRLGNNVTHLLEHSDQRVRLGAALAKGSTSDFRSVQELTAALADLDWLNSAFPKGMPQSIWPVRFQVLHALIERTKPNTVGAETLSAMCKMIETEQSLRWPEDNWGRLLHWVFPERLVAIANMPLPTEKRLPLPNSLTPAQRGVLDVLVRRAELWDRTNVHNASGALMRVQLPFDRPTIRALLERKPDSEVNMRLA